MRQEQTGKQMSDSDKKQVLLKAISDAREAHPDCTIVYFVKHVQAPESLAKPTQKLMQFPRTLAIESVLTALSKQIDVKGLHFYMLKQVGERLKYQPVPPGHTVGQLFDKYGRQDYLSIIYHNKRIGEKSVTPLPKRVIRLAVLVTVVWACIYSWPYVSSFLDRFSSTTL